MKRCHLLFAEPHTGKTYFCEQIEKHLGFVSIFIGNAFREELSTNSDLANAIRGYMDKGQIVPDALVAKLLRNKINATDQNIILLGYPRTKAQYGDLITYFTDADIMITKVWHLRIVNTTDMAQKIYNASPAYNTKYDITVESIKDNISENIRWIRDIIALISESHEVTVIEFDPENKKGTLSDLAGIAEQLKKTSTF